MVAVKKVYSQHVLTGFVANERYHNFAPTIRGGEGEDSSRFRFAFLVGVLETPFPRKSICSKCPTCDNSQHFSGAWRVGG